MDNKLTHTKITVTYRAKLAKLAARHKRSSRRELEFMIDKAIAKKKDVPE